MTKCPFLSVIVPAYRGESTLRTTLPALGESSLPRDAWELIVVDDASDDNTSAYAARHADVVVQLPGKPHGPAYARNRGYEVSRGSVLVFVDSDVRVGRKTLRQIAELFASEEDVAAAFGSYDDVPASPGFASQYRNLMHHYVHQSSGGDAETFWAGLGAIRRSVFIDVGGFDEWHYYRPEIEDIELGRRLRRLGHRIVLRPDIQATHLKHWTLREVIKTDLRHRGIPWMRLLLKENAGETPDTLNLRKVERASTGLTSLGVLFLALAVFLSAKITLTVAALCFAIVLVVNRAFYSFLRKHKGMWFAVRAIPLHLMYYFSNAVSVISGAIVHVLLGHPAPQVETAALAQLEVNTWPPVPTRPGASIWSSDDS